MQFTASTCEFHRCVLKCNFIGSQYTVAFVSGKYISNQGKSGNFIKLME